MRFGPVPFVSVSGVVTTSDGLPAMNFTVWLRGGPATIGYTGIRGGYMTTLVASAMTTIDSEVQPDGTFQFTNLYGLRRIQEMSLPFNWAIQSVEGPKAIFAGQNLAITPRVDLADLRVVLTNRTTTMMATLADDNDKPFAEEVGILSYPDGSGSYRIRSAGASVPRQGAPCITASRLWRVDRLLSGSYFGRS